MPISHTQVGNPGVFIKKKKNRLEGFSDVLLFSSSTLDTFGKD